ncbi:MAG: OmpA family protein [Bacteroidaceae bacterium]
MYLYRSSSTRNQTHDNKKTNQKNSFFFGLGWRIAVFALIINGFSTNLWAQSSRIANKKIDSDSLVMHTTIYYSINNGDSIEKREVQKLDKFLQWALADTLPQIRLQGWADKTGRKEYNRRLSLRRAKSVRNYLVRKGISVSRISFEGFGVDAHAETNKEARRVDVFETIRLVAVSTPQQDVTQLAPIAPVKEEKPEVANDVETKLEKTTVITGTPKSDTQLTQAEIPIEKTKKEYTPSRWYVGVGGGLSFGRGTFCSFAMDGTRPGFNVGVLGGSKINKLLSAELSLDYTRMNLRAYDCCQLLWLSSNGKSYAAPVAGKNNYQYNDLHATTNLFGWGVLLNIDLVRIWNDNSRWSALVSPAICGVYSSANIKQLSTGKSVTDAHSFHFGVGADLGVGYQILPCMGIRFTTGGKYLSGKGMDGLPKEEHKANYVWNTSLKLIFKL